MLPRQQSGRLLQVQGKIDDNESLVADLEEEVESLRIANGKLENRNNLLVGLARRAIGRSL